MKVTKLFGPPGTGKTSALLDIMEKELEDGLPPERLAFLTFTRKARKEAVERTVSRFGYDVKRLPYFRTLHANAYAALNVTGSNLVKEELADFGDLVGMEFTQGRMTDSGLPMGWGNGKGDKLLEFDHLRRHRLQSAEEAYKRWTYEGVTWWEVQKFTKAYREWKLREGLVDFTDLLDRVVDPLPVDVVLVDEAQDLSRLQWRALWRFASKARRVYIAGDDDQAIFIWAGADPDALLEIEGEVRVLGQSWRLPKAVHGEATRMVSGIVRRQPKEFRPRDEEGRVDLVMEPDHVDLKREGSTLILYRNHYLAEPYLDLLRLEGLPYATAEKGSPGAEWGPSIVMWERLRKGMALSPADVRTALDGMRSGGPSVARGAKTKVDRHSGPPLDLDALEATYGLTTRDPWYDALDKLAPPEVEYIRRVLKHHGTPGLLGEPRVHLSTIHAAKGGEADHVILVTDVSGKVRKEIHENPDAERRVFYVGITRARQTLTLVGAHNPLLM